MIFEVKVFALVLKSAIATSPDILNHFRVLKIDFKIVDVLVIF
jgi:hypothetical protein